MLQNINFMTNLDVKHHVLKVHSRAQLADWQ